MSVKEKPKTPLIRRSRGSAKAASESFAARDTLLQIAAEFESLPPETWANTPRDLSINADHYLYGLPKVEE
jgi:hypothetical protein